MLPVSGSTRKDATKKHENKKDRLMKCRAYFSAKNLNRATINNPKLAPRLVLNQALRRDLETGLLSALEDGDFDRTASRFEGVCNRIPRSMALYSSLEESAKRLRHVVALLEDINTHTTWLQKLFAYFHDEEVLFDLSVEAKNKEGEDVLEILAGLMNHIRRCRAVRMRGFAEVESHMLDGLEEAMACPSADSWGGELCPENVPPGAWGQKVSNLLLSAEDAATSNARLYASIRSKRLDSTWSLGDGTPLSAESRVRISEQVIEEIQAWTEEEYGRAEPEYERRKLRKEVAKQQQTTVLDLIKCAEAAGQEVLAHLEVNLGHTCALSVRPEAEVRARAYSSLKKDGSNPGTAEPVDIAQVSIRFNSCQELVRGIHEIQRCCEVIQIENCLAQASPLGRRDVRMIVSQRIDQSITRSNPTHLVQLRLELSCLAQAHKEAASLVETLCQRVENVPCATLIISRLSGNRGPPSFDFLLTEQKDMNLKRLTLRKELEWLDEVLKRLAQDSPNRTEFLQKLAILGTIKDLVLAPLDETLAKIDSNIAEWRCRRVRDKAPVLSSSLIIALLELHGATRGKRLSQKLEKPKFIPVTPPSVPTTRRPRSGGVGGQGGTRCRGLPTGGGGSRHCSYSTWVPEQATRRPPSVESIRSASRMSHHMRDLTEQEEIMLSVEKDHDKSVPVMSETGSDLRFLMSCLYSERQNSNR